MVVVIQCTSEAQQLAALRGISDWRVSAGLKVHQRNDLLYLGISRVGVYKARYWMKHARVSVETLKAS